MINLHSKVLGLNVLWVPRSEALGAGVEIVPKCEEKGGTVLGVYVNPIGSQLMFLIEDDDGQLHTVEANKCRIEA